MNRFFKELLKFGIFFTICTAILGGTTFIIKRNANGFELPPEKTVLVVGDSYTAYAVNDKVLTNVFNFSQGASAYFYSYLKIKEILDSNPQIKTVVVGYSYENISKSRDEWFYGSRRIQRRMPQFFHLFSVDDFCSLFASNPIEVLRNSSSLVNISKTIEFFSSDNNMKSMGEYRDLDRDKLPEAIKHYDPSKETEKAEYSKYEKKYLLKIYELVMSKNVNLILLNTPTHSLIRKRQDKYKTHYFSFAKQNMPEAVILNHSDIFIPEEGFGDPEHLNRKGAKFYSEYLKKHKLFDLTDKQ